jgi:hypothetical protein
LSFSGPPISLADFSARIDFNPNVADMALGISTTTELFQTSVTCAPLGPGLCGRLNFEHRENHVPNGGVVSGSASWRTVGFEPARETTVTMTHQEIVEGMRKLRKRIKSGKMSVRQMVEEGRRF